MQSGIYLIIHGEPRLFATMDDLQYGNEFTREVIGQDILGAICNAAEECDRGSGSRSKLTIVIVQ
jgi:hypothetical protein